MSSVSNLGIRELLKLQTEKKYTSLPNAAWKYFRKNSDKNNFVKTPMKIIDKTTRRNHTRLVGGGEGFGASQAPVVGERKEQPRAP